ncbi:unnamed protein product [Amoebophrya sp. A25]|nr:unnamed protein product [Amoebophrya sp. A25]|eukprot:GSA25T00021496001.1
MCSCALEPDQLRVAAALTPLMRKPNKPKAKKEKQEKRKGRVLVVKVTVYETNNGNYLVEQDEELT